MERNEFYFKALDGLSIYYRVWTPDMKEKPKAVIQIIHGIAEHCSRYDDFASFLAKQGYVVYAHDHRGHGYTAAKPSNIGYFAEENGWQKAVEDIVQMNITIKKENPRTPVIMVAHSMGSFLARTFIQNHSKEINALVLSGTASNPGALGVVGRFLAKRQIKKKGFATPSPFLDNMAFGSYNKKINVVRTPFDWLSRDNDIVDKYIADPLCGFIGSSSIYYDMLDGMIGMYQKDGFRSIRKELPLFIISGSKDPVGDYGRGFNQVVATYKNHGMSNVNSKLYPGARHEILNETNKEEVYNDILDFIKEII